MPWLKHKSRRRPRILFITGTDTGVGKTVATFALAVLFKKKGLSVGVMKPVQCGGQDAQFLKTKLALKEDLREINPYYAPEPLSPHLAFRRARQKIEVATIFRTLIRLCQEHDVLLIEGAGGLMVPLKTGYFNADLARDLKAELIIVARLGLGTINHTLLTIQQARRSRLRVRGVLFSDTNPGPKSIPEQTNPAEIRRLSGIRVLGTIPYLKAKTEQDVLRQCRNIQLE